MNVYELIEELNKIENKNTKVLIGGVRNGKVATPTI